MSSARVIASDTCFSCFVGRSAVCSTTPQWVLGMSLPFIDGLRLDVIGSCSWRLDGAAVLWLWFERLD
ncbi:hypothetical protein VB1_CDS0038 [Arthrobacter phage Marchesin]|nr:hypothetical protein VB1_CDS0038 [Arthrobacter phage Marchesin]